MSFETIFREALRALLRNRVRTGLTMLGIIVGVGSFICVVGVGRAGSKRVEEQLQNVGDNLLAKGSGRRDPPSFRCICRCERISARKREECLEVYDWAAGAQKLWSNSEDTVLNCQTIPRAREGLVYR